jgi:hypothetical protein
MNLDASGEHARVHVDQEFDAQGVQGLMAELTRLRARMSPAFPTTPPADTAELTGTECRFAFRVDGDGDGRFWILHAGLGWISCRMPVAAMLPLADLLRQATSNHAPEPAFFSFDGSRRPDTPLP